MGGGHPRTSLGFRVVSSCRFLACWTSLVHTGEHTGTVYICISIRQSVDVFIVAGKSGFSMIS